MDKQFISQDIIPNFLVVFMGCTLVWRSDLASVFGFAIACAFWISIQFVKMRAEKPGPLQAELQSLKDQMSLLDKTVLANAEYSAKEFGTLKNVLQIKQLGR